ncbi:hypothetical protein DQ04_27121000, partial [Trypanosoma grayi]|uniref:hypothetical protein n=1 Tax=Trypanosoma grayi TaxID=71804 RepID=UPI0004F46527
AAAAAAAAGGDDDDVVVVVVFFFSLHDLHISRCWLILEMTGGGDAHTTTPAEAAAAAISPTVSIATLCEARAVDAQLLHNSSELAASNLLRRSSRYVTAGRVLSLMALASAAAAGLLASWQ